MADETRMQRVENDDPCRCQGVTGKGQCQIRAIEGSNFCPMHAGAGSRTLEREKLRNFRLTKWQGRINEFADNDAAKSLREEIGILRMMLEESLNKCRDSHDLILSSGRISDLVLKIEKLVVSCHRLEEKTGMLLDKTAILQLAGTIIECIAKHNIPEDVLSKISDEIIVAVASVKTEQPCTT